uniref:Putative secreted protein n=1 Tax=Anopheles darlingi TaxID=43151 RepID=A0A2M4D2A9_ANODA
MLWRPRLWFIIWLICNQSSEVARWCRCVKAGCWFCVAVKVIHFNFINKTEAGKRYAIQSQSSNARKTRKKEGKESRETRMLRYG